MTSIIILLLIVFAAAVLQTLSGFGFALIVMPVAVTLLGVDTAVPVVALTALILYSFNLVRYRHIVNWTELKRLGIAVVLGVPVGILLLANLPEATIRFLLGLLLVGYALYVLFAPQVTAVMSPHWGYIAGFCAGCLGGAYNVPGPPVVVYGSASQWPKEQFRAILQSLFFLQGCFVVLGHTLAGNLTADTAVTSFYTIPALLLGIFIGTRFDQRVSQQTFRTFIAVLILILGVTLLL